MKFEGIYKGKLTTLDLPVSDYQWAAFHSGRSSADHCFPGLDREQLQFITSAYKVAEERKVLYDVQNYEQMSL